MISPVGDGAAALAATLQATDAFRNMPAAEIYDLARRMSTVAYNDGDVIVRQHMVSEGLFVVLSGSVRMTVIGGQNESRILGEVESGNLVDGLNLFSGVPALATFTACGKVELAALSKAAFAEFSGSCPAGALTLMEILRPQLRRHRLWLALHASDMFRDLEPIALRELESEFELVALYGGEVLFQQGDAGHDLYIVVSGRLRVVAGAADGAEAVLAELGTGEVVGEMAAISGEPRSATVYAARDTELAKLSRASLDRAIQRHPRAILHVLTGQLVDRLRRTSRGHRKLAAVVTIAVVPASAEVSLAEFSATLTQSLARMGPTLLLTSALVDEQCGRPGMAQAPDRAGGSAGLLDWLVAQEMEHRYVVYQADPRLSPWTERSVRQADRIVLLADAGADAAPGELEGELLQEQRARRTPVTLVLLHPENATAPSGTARWLSGRTLERHLHVRRGTTADYDRVARFVTGTAVGLTLGGGFARGLAHIGVFRALQELSIPVDAIGGASMGAIVGAQWVLGWEPARIVDEINSGFADSFDDMTIPFVAFKRGGKASKLVKRLFGETRIEDMWLPFFCVSANLNRAELKIHTAGRVAEAVLASSRAPGIFPPIVIDGELHIDGGTINNVPVDVMKSFGGDGIVIGVDVSPPHELNSVADYGEDVPGWRAIWNRFHPSPEKRVYRPSLLLVLLRLIEFGGISYRRAKAALADVYISPDVIRFKRNDFHAAHDLADAGYRAAREQLMEWFVSAPESVRSRRPDLFRAAARESTIPAPSGDVRL